MNETEFDIAEKDGEITKEPDHLKELMELAEKAMNIGFTKMGAHRRHGIDYPMVDLAKLRSPTLWSEDFAGPPLKKRRNLNLSVNAWDNVGMLVPVKNQYGSAFVEMAIRLLVALLDGSPKELGKMAEVIKEITVVEKVRVKLLKLFALLAEINETDE